MRPMRSVAAVATTTTTFKEEASEKLVWIYKTAAVVVVGFSG